MYSSQLLTVLAAVSVASAASTTNPWATYPSVPKTATYNGFADPLWDSVPECARSCLTASTSSTPCPYWDTGCLCVMSNWSGPVAQCVAEACSGNNIDVFTTAASSLCSRVGVPSPFWFIPDAAIAALSTAAANGGDATTPASSTPAAASSTAAETSAPQTSAPAETTAPAETSAATSAAASTEAAAAGSSAVAAGSSAVAAVSSAAAAVSSAAAASSAAAESSAPGITQVNGGAYNAPAAVLAGAAAVAALF